MVSSLKIWTHIFCNGLINGTHDCLVIRDDKEIHKPSNKGLTSNLQSFKLILLVSFSSYTLMYKHKPFSTPWNFIEYCLNILQFITGTITY